MADVHHLEKMGRELQCPICLSLLTSPMSLICNHIFCNFCILKSMKARANCPVCEVPFRRREIRPATHMENLISIFKSMEAAAGLNIFTTQTSTLLKSCDGANEDSSEKHPSLPETVKQHREKEKKKSISRSEANESDKVDTPNAQSVKMPSFPSKKRVHVTPYPISESPIHSKKLQRPQDLVELETKKDLNIYEHNKDLNVDADGSNENTVLLKETYSKNKYSNPVLSPFFWLRDDVDPDEATGDTNSQQTYGSNQPDPIIPSFSDIQDLDDSGTKKTSPTKAAPVKQIFDSEVFEWTQRECSPELFATPSKKKVRKKGQPTAVLGVKLAEERYTPISAEGSGDMKGKPKGFRTKTRKNLSSKVKKGKKKKNLNDVSPGNDFSHKHLDLTENLTVEDITTKNNSSGSGKEDSVVERGTISISSAQHTLNILSDHEPCHLMTDKKEYENKNDGKRKAKLRPTRKVKKKADVALTAIPEGTSLGIGIQGNLDSTTLPAASCQEVEDSEGLEYENENGKVNTASTELQKSKMRGAENLKRSANEIDHEGALESGKSRTEKQLANAYRRRRVSEDKGQGSLHRDTSIERTTEDQEVPPTQMGAPEATFLSENPQTDKHMASPNSVRTIEGLNNSKEQLLRKCGAAKFKCAFCRSSKDTEVSGEMMHYFRGKPVDANFDGSTNIIHSHKHCTEWAPNVYFEDETAVNLGMELTRSKRIKCSKCGIKGAALGCYDKACRRSFHFTCAKTMDCRWDNENFVMLCPSHLTSRLPNETANLEKTRKNRSVPRRESQSLAATKPNTNADDLWKWPSGSTNKWLLCCSAVSTEEKEVITSFAKLSGTTISKVWNPNVTHVIAATDDNGACKRTLKVLMGIIEGKWILSIDWLKACMSAGAPVEEEPFEIRVDNHGIRDGPRMGRLRALDKKQKLFAGYQFYFIGDFTTTYKGYLQELVTAAGGTVLQRRPISRDAMLNGVVSATYIIFSCEFPEKLHNTSKEKVIAQRKADAKMLADACGVLLADNTWILDSISSSTVLTPKD